MVSADLRWRVRMANVFILILLVAVVTRVPAHVHLDNMCLVHIQLVLVQVAGVHVRLDGVSPLNALHTVTGSVCSALINLQTQNTQAVALDQTIVSITAILDISETGLFALHVPVVIFASITSKLPVHNV